MHLPSNRRRFITALTASGCIACLPGMAGTSRHTRPGVPMRWLEPVLASYGTPTRVRQHGHRIDIRVRIRDLEKLPVACAKLSERGKVHAAGNDLRIVSGPYRIHIRNRV